MSDVNTAQPVESVPAVEESSPFELSHEERQYLESGGEETEAPAVEAGQPAEAEQKADAPDEQPTEDDDYVEVVEGKEGKKFVPHGAMHRERELRKAREAELAKERESKVRVEERLKLIAEALQAQNQQQQAPEDPEPNEEEDPIGYIKWQKREMARIANRVDNFERTTQASTQERAIHQAYAADAQRYASQNAEFAEAYRFLIAGRDAELQAYGIHDPAERNERINAEERELVRAALSEGASPAERVFKLAQARGYAKAQRAAQAAAQQPQSQTQSKIDEINRGQQAAKSLSNVGGGNSGEMTFEALDKMDNSEFDAFLSKLTPSQLREYLGG